MKNLLPIAMLFVLCFGFSSKAQTPLINLQFNENEGSTVKNTGSIGGTFTLSDGSPMWSNKSPGNKATNVSSVDFGTEPGEFVVESDAVLPQLGGLASFTITGWVNSTDAVEGQGGNRILHWLNFDKDGVDLVYHPDGSLQLAVNQWPDNSPAFSSSGRITTDAGASAANWKFFAATYEPANGVSFYFGDATTKAEFDVTIAYDMGPVAECNTQLAIGHFNSTTRSMAGDRTFRGLIDQIQIFGEILDLTKIQTVQNISTTSVASINNSSDLTVYPNPTSGLVSIKTSDFQNSTYKVYNLLGSLLLSKKFANECETVDLSAKKGMYLIVVENGKTKSTERVIVQ